MREWQPVSLVTPSGELRAPGRVADEIRREGAAPGIVLTGHAFGSVLEHARLLCRQLATVARPWAAHAAVEVGRERALLQLARESGCRALVLGPEPNPLVIPDPEGLRGFAADLRRIRRAGLGTVLHLALGRDGDDAGVFHRAVWLATAGRVVFPRVMCAADAPMDAEELGRGLAWARRALHGHTAIWRRAGRGGPGRLAAVVANYRARRVLVVDPTPRETDAMRLARVLARPIPVRERTALVSTLVGAVHAGGDQLRHAWLRARAVRDATLAALVIRLEGAVDARAARTLVARVRRGLRGTRMRVVVDVSGVELVSLSVLTRFLEEHAGRLAELRGWLTFRNLRPALEAVRRNLHGPLPSAAVLAETLEDAT